ncbi:MAG: Hsp70 family protein [Lachnospiraceae bacterium]|nr:Hsp70 family protein [Lachnospiraceae bacterium]
MEKFYGFDLGDAESAISRMYKKDAVPPEIIRVCGEKSFITAYANLENGEVQIGEKACYNSAAVKRRIRFKSRFLSDPESESDVRRFAAGVLSELYGSGDLVKEDEDCCFYVGCPAGWGKNARERYREIFERCGYPPTRIVSESRAALVSACQSRHLQVGYDILSKPVLVVDIGSSTTDFAYITNGKETALQTAGEVALGGGLMDELLLDICVDASRDKSKIRKVFEESEPWRNYCEFAARKLKEKYFSDEAYWKDNECSDTVLIQYQEPLRLRLFMDPQTADKLTTGGIRSLGGSSFKSVFVRSLRDVRDKIDGIQPELLFLTGGVSKLEAIRGWCSDVFPESVVIAGAEPEFSVSRGLAWSGKIDEELREFKKDLELFKASRKVEDIVKSHMEELYRGVVDTMVDPILQDVAAPVFERWRKGEVRTLSDVDDIMQRDVNDYLKGDKAKGLMVKPVSAWLRTISNDLEQYTIPICVNHNVPYSALSLNSYLSASDVDIKLDAKDIFAVQDVTILIDSIISILVGLVCGGSGVALISSGPAGIIAGVVISFILLLLGKNKMEEALLNADIPKIMRKLISKNSFASRLDSLSASVKDGLLSNFEGEKNEEMIDRMVDEVSVQIEECLTKMAQVVEIPLG